MTTLNLVPAFFYFGDSNSTKFKGLHNPLNLWNGWANPLIHSDSIQAVLDVLHDDEYQIAKMDGNKVYLKELQYDDVEADILEPIVIDGEVYYDFFYLGFCFESMSLARYEERLHQEARDLMDEINDAHKWDSKLSLDEYLMTHFDDLTNAEMSDIQTLLDKFYNL